MSNKNIFSPISNLGVIESLTPKQASDELDHEVEYFILTLKLKEDENPMTFDLNKNKEIRNKILSLIF